MFAASLHTGSRRPPEFHAAAATSLGVTPEWQSACSSTPPIRRRPGWWSLNGNRLEEFDFESSTKKQVKGNIYLARVTRVEPSLQAAFVEYGGNRHGFLAFSEIHPDYYRIPVGDRREFGADPQAREPMAGGEAGDDAARAAEEVLPEPVTVSGPRRRVKKRARASCLVSATRSASGSHWPRRPGESRTRDRPSATVGCPTASNSLGRKGRSSCRSPAKLRPRSPLRRRPQRLPSRRRRSWSPRRQSRFSPVAGGVGLRSRSGSPKTRPSCLSTPIRMPRPAESPRVATTGWAAASADDDAVLASESAIAPPQETAPDGAIALNGEAADPDVVETLGGDEFEEAERRARASAPPALQNPGSDQAPADHAGPGHQGGARQQGRGADDLSVARRPLLRADAQHAARRRRVAQDHHAQRPPPAQGHR